MLNIGAVRDQGVNGTNFQLLTRAWGRFILTILFDSLRKSIWRKKRHKQQCLRGLSGTKDTCEKMLAV